MNSPLVDVRTEEQAPVAIRHLDPIALGLLIDAVEAKAQRARADFMQDLVRQCLRYVAGKLSAPAHPGAHLPAHAR